MGKFYNTPACVSDAAGHNVNFDTEYMYTSTGKKLPILYFKYDREQGWIACSEAGLDDCAKCDKSTIMCSDYRAKCISGYKVSELYMQHPAVTNTLRLIDDMYRLKERMAEHENDTYALFMYVYMDLGKKDPRIKALTAMPLLEIIVNDIIDKLHKLNKAEEN